MAASATTATLAICSPCIRQRPRCTGAGRGNPLRMLWITRFASTGCRWGIDTRLACRRGPAPAVANCARSEFVVQPETHRVHGRIELGGGAAEAAGEHTDAVEVVVEVLHTRRQIGCEGALDAATRDPAGLGLRMPAEAGARIVEACPRRTTGCIEQPAIVIAGQAHASTHRREPVDAVAAAAAVVALDPSRGQVGL